jgi:hypothetical protein
VKNSDLKIDFFGDGMRIFLDYISRQLAKNPNYKPHPIVRALECALEGVEKCEVGKKTMGVSQDGTEKSVYQPYVVVLEKKENGVEVKEIRNLKVDKELPLDVMVVIFRLQIHLDRIEGDTVTPQQMVDTLNEVIPGKNFYALGDRWMEARDIFREKMKKGQISIHKGFLNKKDIDELTKIRFDTKWEDYSPKLRSFIGMGITDKLGEDGKIVVTTPTNFKIEKYKVFDSAVEFMIGKTSEYMKPVSQTTKTKP